MNEKSSNNFNSTCVKCSEVLRGAYCSNCGLAQSPKRINRSYIFSEMASVINFDKGILLTIRELIVRPGENIRRFILEDRGRLVKPISFVLLCSLVYIVAQRVLRFEDGYMAFNFDEWGDSWIATLMGAIIGNYGLANVVMAFFVALWLKWMFRSSNFSFYEILVALYYVMGIQMLMFAIFGVIEYFVGHAFLDKASLLAFFYMTWALVQFIGNKKLLDYVKVFFSYFFGMAFFVISAVLFGALLDFITQ